MEYASIVEALIITAGVVIAQVAISYRSQSVIVYRIQELEKKQDKHNSLIERMVVVESRLDSIDRH